VGCEGTKNAIIAGSSISAMAIPYITKAMLLPNSKAPSTFEGSLKKTDRIFAENRPLFLSSSIFSLFELIKAISIPENRAENTREIITIVQLLIKVVAFIDHPD
jgi:hypothetical protein